MVKYGRMHLLDTHGTLFKKAFYVTENHKVTCENCVEIKYNFNLNGSNHF